MKDKDHNWMPVFAVVESTKKRFAVYPGQESSITQKEGIENEDYEIRVGTAIAQDDDSYKIKLVVFPVDGRLIMRPPRRGEHQDLTHKERSL